MTPRKITYEVRDDGPGPDVNDVLYSTRSYYLVVSSRAISTRDGSRKFSLGVLRFTPDEWAKANRAPRRWMTLKWDSRAPKHGRRSAPAR